MKEVYRLKPGMKAVKRVKLNEEFTVNTTNAFGREIRDSEDFEKVLGERIGHPVFGPVFVEGVKAGECVEVFIRKVKANKRAYQCISFSTGVLKGKFGIRNYKIYKVKDGMVEVGGVPLKVKPSVGYISTMPEKEVSCGRACRNGGNLDFNQLTAGSSIVLPTSFSGAMLFVGDLHILQGNGEICGMALECGGEVTLEVRRSPVAVDYPVIRTSDGVMIVGYGGAVIHASKSAVRNAIAYCEQEKRMDGEDSYLYLSAKGDITFGNFTGTVKTCAVYIKDNLYSYSN
jgi:amidase